MRTLGALKARCRLTHVGTRHPERLAGVTTDPVAVLPEWADVIQADCDAVIIATPPQTHVALLEACLKAGKPCIIEKPLCLDLAEAERVHRRVAERGVPVLVDHTQLFHPAYEALARALAQAGEPVRVACSEGMALGPFRSDVPALWDWAPHDVSLCLDLFGRAPAGVAALGGPRSQAGAPELVSLRLEFSGGGCGWIQAGRLSPVRRRTLTVFTDTRVYRLEDAARPSLEVAPLAFASREGAPRVESLSWAPIPFDAARAPMERMVSYFLDGVAGGDQARFGTGPALDVVRVLSACAQVLEPARTR